MYVEFVTEPFVENTDGKLDMNAAIDGILIWMKRMIALTERVKPPKNSKVEDVSPRQGTSFPLPGWWNRAIRIRVTAPLTLDAIEIYPQATGGVPLERIPALMQQALPPARARREGVVHARLHPGSGRTGRHRRHARVP
jgi:hypothetical protein